MSVTRLGLEKKKAEKEKTKSQTLGMAVHTYNTSSHEAEAGGS